MGKQFLEIIEEIYLDVLPKKYSGRTGFDKFDDVKKEIEDTLIQKYGIVKIEELKKNSNQNLTPEITPHLEILKGLVEYNKHKFIPSSFDLRMSLLDKLSAEDKLLVEEIKNECQNEIIELINRSKLDYIDSGEGTDEQRQTKLKEFELLVELNHLLPNVPKIKSHAKWNGLAMSIKQLLDRGIPTEHYENHLQLIEGRCKIQLGKLGNIMRTMIPLEKDKRKIQERNVIELLFMND